MKGEGVGCDGESVGSVRGECWECEGCDGESVGSVRGECWECEGRVWGV